MKVVITGAAGQISYSLIPFLCEKGIFNSEEKLDLALVEIPGAMERLDGFVKNSRTLPTLLSIQFLPMTIFKMRLWMLIGAYWSVRFREVLF